MAKRKTYRRTQQVDPERPKLTRRFERPLKIKVPKNIETIIRYTSVSTIGRKNNEWLLVFRVSGCRRNAFHNEHLCSCQELYGARARMHQLGCWAILQL